MLDLKTILLGFVGAVLLSVPMLGQENGEKTFTSPSDASTALYNAVKSADKAAMEAVLGPSSQPLLSSGDEVQDKKNGEFFLEHYERMNRWGKETNGDETLFLGADNWPFPIPLKKNASGQWYFDTKAGADEVLFRRIGSNEFAAIRVCKALAGRREELYR